MQNIAKETGVQSYCYRHFKDNAKVAELVKESGLDRIELCAVHVDFNDEASFDGVIDTYKKAGVQIASIGVEGFADNEPAERKRFEFAKKAGAKVITCSFAIDKTPGCYRTAEKLAEKYGIPLAIHNHGGRHWLGSAAVLKHVFSQTSEVIGLCIDTAWALDSGENPVAMAEQFADRLYGVHIKDFVFDRARKPEDVVVGTGNLDLPKLAAVLRSTQTVGSCVLEYEGDVENPVPAMKKCVAALKAL
jgi:sugar phosphate isomerase/epimerase